MDAVHTHTYLVFFTTRQHASLQWHKHKISEWHSAGIRHR